MARARRPMFPGHLQGQADQRDVALSLLLGHNDRYPPFLQDCADLQPVPGGDANSAMAHQAARLVAARWGLDQIPLVREMDYRLLREGLLQTGHRIAEHLESLGPFSHFAMAKVVPEDPRVDHDGEQWSWHLARSESLAELGRRIYKDLGLRPRARLPAAIEDQLRDLPARADAAGWRLTDVRPTLADQVQWLFWRLCPQPDRPLTYGEIAECVDAERAAPSTDDRSVRRTVQRLATDLDIDLPRGPGRSATPRTAPRN